MAAFTAGDLHLDLRNPEYMPRPEILISELAALNYSVDEWEVASNRVAGPIYRTEARTTGNVEFVPTDPYSPRSPNTPEKWAAALRAAGLVVERDLEQVAEVLASSFVGVRATKGKGQAATPMTPGLAALQNARGMTGKRNPYNVAAAIERMYALGGGRPPEEGEDRTAATQWDLAVKGRLASDPLLRLLDGAVRDALLRNHSPRADQRSGQSGSVPDLGPTTPFAWFRESWDRLNAPAWVEALPPRRWTDWATTVIRAGLGFGYLWEIRWYETIARAVLTGSTGSQGLDWDGLFANVRASGALLSWENSDEPVSIRDVASPLRENCLRYAPLAEEVKTNFGSSDGEPVADALRRVSGDAEAREQFRRALGQSGTNENCFELVRWVLLRSNETGRYADHYGLLAKVGPRWTVVDPATEWVAVIASLSMEDPESETTLREVSSSLAKLGLRPSNAELVRHLERAGLARGSSDADGAVIVKSAY